MSGARGALRAGKVIRLKTAFLCFWWIEQSLNPDPSMMEGWGDDPISNYECNQGGDPH
jgi:hypothetical protein